MNLLSRFHIALLLFAVLSLSTNAHAYTVSVIPSGDKTFSVQGSGMDGATGIRLDISYDAASLVIPSVTPGGAVTGAMFAANTNQPGYIRIAIISTNTFSSNGQIATITFASKTGSGGITSVTSSMIDKTGAQLASNPNKTSPETPSPDPVVPFSQPTQQVSTSNSSTITKTSQTSASTSGTTPIYAGAVTLPTDVRQKSDTQPAPIAPNPDYGTETAQAKVTEQIEKPEKPTAVAKAEETPQYVVYKGIFERFKQYKENKKLASMAALFDRKVAAFIEQSPHILLTDGRTKAVLSIDLPARISSSPNFAVSGGKLVSFIQDKQLKGRWIVEVLPDVATGKSTVTIIAGVEQFEYPLTVAPEIKKTQTFDEKGWNIFLKEVGTVNVPLHDLNNDGVRDYMDEYIFVANYLVQKEVAAKVPEKK
jgi:hypothetical protein